jgi:hypothetical protein
MPGSAKFNKTEESIFTLLSLAILIVQAFESLTGKEDVLNSEFNLAKPTFHDLVTDTIHEALVYQILLKGCAFLDEWNTIFGVKTENRDREKILSTKQIAKPAYKCIVNWKQLKDFRNHFIAHNHRDKSGANVYLHPKTYNSPQSNGEIYLFVFCINKMTDVVNYFFEKEVAKGLKIKPSGKTKGQKFLTKKMIMATVKSIDEEISSSIMRVKMLEALVGSVTNSQSV